MASAKAYPFAYDTRHMRRLIGTGSMGGNFAFMHGVRVVALLHHSGSYKATGHALCKAAVGRDLLVVIIRDTHRIDPNRLSCV